MQRLWRWVSGALSVFLGLCVALAALVFAVHSGTGAMAAPPAPGSFDAYPAGWSSLQSAGRVQALSQPSLVAEPDGASVFALLPGGAGVGRWQYRGDTGALTGPQATGLKASQSQLLDATVLPAAGGGYHVAWRQSGAGGQQAMYARLDASLQVAAGPLALQAPGLQVDTPAMAPLADGDVLLVWDDFASPGGYHLWQGRVHGGQLAGVSALPEQGRQPQLLAEGNTVHLVYERVDPQAPRPAAYIQLGSDGRVLAGPESIDPGSPYVRSLRLLPRPGGGLVLLIGQRQATDPSRPAVEGAELLLKPPGGAWSERQELARSLPLLDLTGAVAGDRLHVLLTTSWAGPPAVFYLPVSLADPSHPGAPVLASDQGGGNRLPQVAAIGKGVLTVWVHGTAEQSGLALRDSLHPAPVPAAARIGLDPASPLSNAVYDVLDAIFQSVVAVAGGLVVVALLGLLLALLASRLPETLRLRNWLIIALAVAGSWLFAWIPNPLQLFERLWPTQTGWPLWALLLAPIGATAALAAIVRVQRWRPTDEVLVILPITALWLFFHRLILSLPFIAHFR